MREEDFPSRDAYVRARLDDLKRRLREMDGAASFACPGLDPETELAFLEQVYAIESEPCVTYAHQLIEQGICLPAPDSLEDATLGQKLWEVIEGLAALRVFLENTGHLTDRELYERLWTDHLNEFTWDMSGCRNGAMHLDLLGSGSEEDTRTWLEVFASEHQREEWRSQFPGEPLPPRRNPVSDRDARLPRPGHDRP